MCPLPDLGQWITLKHNLPLIDHNDSWKSKLVGSAESSLVD